MTVRTSIYFTSLLLILLLTATFACAADYKESITGMEFAFIKGGAYMMGDIYGSDKYAKPTHKVSIKDFYLGKQEVTFDQYDQFCEDTKREKPDDQGWGRGNRPVINVTWKDAVAFVAWLNKKSVRTFRLPSESEWEYAARAGRSTRFWWGNKPGVGLANCSNCVKEKPSSTTPVGSFSSNPLGLYDMNGNVYEFVADDWHENYNGAPADGSAWLDGDTKNRVSRGGCWYYEADEMTSSRRNWDFDEPYNYQGFRVVLEP
jgi:formylglycine-generating enzyme required for sulfatase activity